MQDVQVAVGQALLFRLKGVDEQAAIREALAGDPASNGHEIRELLRPLDWHALWDAEDDIDWLIHPLMPARSLVALYSPAGIGKSLLMLEIGAGLSCGREILGHRSGKRYRVLYIDFENDPIRDIRDRLQSMGYEPEDLDHLTYLSFPSMAHLDSPQGAAELLAAVEAFGSEVVVIDTISRAVAGEENDNDTWLNFCKYTGLALKQKGVSCIRLDHTGKDLTKGERGGIGQIRGRGCGLEADRAGGGEALQAHQHQIPVPAARAGDHHSATRPASASHPRKHLEEG